MSGRDHHQVGSEEVSAVRLSGFRSRLPLDLSTYTGPYTVGTLGPLVAEGKQSSLIWENSIEPVTRCGLCSFPWYNQSRAYPQPDRVDSNVPTKHERTTKDSATRYHTILFYHPTLKVKSPKRSRDRG
jgi:hypothetical protein